jgi:hypothetical protein
MKEAELEAKIRDYARAKGCLCWKFVSPGNPGVPDRIIISPAGAVLFMEVKRPGQKPRPLQQYKIHELTRHKVNAIYVDNLQDARGHIDALGDSL